MKGKFFFNETKRTGLEINSKWHLLANRLKVSKAPMRARDSSEATTGEVIHLIAMRVAQYYRM